MSALEEYYQKLLQNAGDGNLREKVKKATFYLDERIDELQKNFNVFITEKIEKNKRNLPYYKTEMINKKNYSINGREMIMELEGKGLINQILIESESDNFGIFFMIDNKLVYEEPYKYLQNLAEHLEDMTTYKNEHFYLNLKNFGFIKSIIFYITSEKQVKINNISIKYILYEKN